MYLHANAETYTQNAVSFRRFVTVVVVIAEVLFILLLIQCLWLITFHYSKYLEHNLHDPYISTVLYDY